MSATPFDPDATTGSERPPPPPSHPRVPFGEKPGDFIGPYKLLEVIGEGGFGTVYEAEQAQPHRHVALKIIREGFASASLLRRFEAEAEILGRLQHPGIAQIFEAGTFDRGRGTQPFFAMELIKGTQLTEFARQRALSTRQRLGLLIKICDAVQHAHARGIIHRDLKPANILVTDDGQPKILDFGVARATDSDVKSTTLQTDIGQIIGTLAYMSPEQAGGDPADLDTRSDVYALGVIAYELLAERLPYDLGQKMIHEALRIIREEEPSKLSTVNRTLRGDLEVIVGKALAKEKERRYETAAALAKDLERYLSDEPIAARSPSTWYQLSKFSRRNKGLVGGVVAAFVVLLAGLATSTYAFSKADFERTEKGKALVTAQENEQKAKDEAERATKAEKAEKERADQLKKVSDFQSQMLAQVDTTRAGIDLMADVRERFVAALEKSGVPEAERTARVDALRQELIRVNATDTAAAMIDRTILRPAIKTIDEQFKHDPPTDASLRQALADLYETIGMYDAAMPLQESALATRRRVLGEEHPDTLVSMNSMGMLRYSQGQFDQAEPYLREALEKRRRVRGEEHPDTLTSINDMGRLLQDRGKLDQAEPYLREAMEKSRRVLGEEHPDTLASINNFAVLRQHQGRMTEAETYRREELEKSRRVLGEEHPNTLGSINNMGDLLLAQGKPAEAEPYYRECLEKSRRVLGEEHPITLIFINNMGLPLQAQGKLAEAELYFREALEKRRRVLGGEHPDTLSSINNIGALLRRWGKLAEAEPYYREGLELSRRVLGEEHPYTLAFINNLGGLLLNQGKLAEAEPYHREVLEKSRRVLGEEHPKTISSISNMGVLLHYQGKLAEAEPYYREDLEKSRRVLGEEHPNTLISINNIGRLLQSQGKLAEAEPYLREAVDKRRRVLGEEHPDTLDSVSSMTRLQLDQNKAREAFDLITPYEPAARKRFTGGIARRLADFLTALARARVGVGFDPERFAQAEANLLEAHPIYLAAKDRGPTHKDTLECVQALMHLYTAWDKAEPGKGYDAKAAEWQAKLNDAKAEKQPAEQGTTEKK